MTNQIISRIGQKTRMVLAGAFIAGSLLAALPLTTSAHAASSQTTVNCTADGTLDSEEQAFLGLINNYRQQHGLGALATSDTLNRAGAWKSQDMGANGYFSHDDILDGSTWRTVGDRLNECGYSEWVGENIAAGMPDAATAFDMWKNSPGHNANMLSSDAVVIGIGRAYVAGSPFGWYWTTVFGRQMDVEPQPSRTLRCADFNNDGIVLGSDIIYVIQNYLSDNPQADLDGSGRVMITDVLAAISQYRTHCDA